VPESKLDWNSRRELTLSVRSSPASFGIGLQRWDSQLLRNFECPSPTPPLGTNSFRQNSFCGPRGVLVMQQVARWRSGFYHVYHSRSCLLAQTHITVYKPNTTTDYASIGLGLWSRVPGETSSSDQPLTAVHTSQDASCKTPATNERLCVTGGTLRPHKGTCTLVLKHRMATVIKVSSPHHLVTQPMLKGY